MFFLFRIIFIFFYILIFVSLIFKWCNIILLDNWLLFFLFFFLLANTLCNTDGNRHLFIFFFHLFLNFLIYFQYLNLVSILLWVLINILMQRTLDFERAIKMFFSLLLAAHQIFSLFYMWNYLLLFNWLISKWISWRLKFLMITQLKFSIFVNNIFLICIQKSWILSLIFFKFFINFIFLLFYL